ncbi:MAG: DUF4349 domain-containing protein [Crocinitomicaceae bacterium]|nr:DUF4349 domain-containing protein [Crocinitomicaceae bacterium]
MKKVLLLSIVVVLFSCGGGYNESRKDENKAEVNAAANEDYAEENVAGGYSDDVPMEMTAETVRGTNHADYAQEGKDLDKLEQPVNQKNLDVPKMEIDAKIIKTANMKFQVDDVDMTTNKISSILKTKGAYISDMNQSKNRNHFYSELTIRVPNLYFDDLLMELSLTGEKVDYKRVSSQDVTEEYVDIQTRLKTKKEVKKIYEEILRSKAKTVAEVLDTEEKLRRIQEEIEVQEGRMRYLKNQVNMSTIYLTIYEEGVNLDEVASKRKFSERATSGFEAGWAAILNVVVAMTYAWPGILITLIVIIWKRKWLFSIRRKVKELFSPAQKEA